MLLCADNVTELKAPTDAAADSTGIRVAERSVGFSRCHVSDAGDIRSENADMSNDTSCE